MNYLLVEDVSNVPASSGNSSTYQSRQSVKRRARTPSRSCITIVEMT